MKRPIRWIYVLIVVPLASYALAPTMAGSTDTDAMRNPSGNIRCRAYGLETVVCTSIVPSRSVRLTAGYHAHLTKTQKIGNAPITSYGDAWNGDLRSPAADFTCGVERSGVTCTDGLSHGFTISRQHVQTW